MNKARDQSLFCNGLSLPRRWNGFRYYFQKLGTDLLCINTLGGRSLDAISLDLKSGKGQYESDYRKSVYVKANKARARDTTSSFRLLYLILRAEFEDETKTRQKVYNAVLSIISHSAIFKHHVCNIIRRPMRRGSMCRTSRGQIWTGGRYYSLMR